MAFPRASQALSRFTVLDLTRVRSGPTCVRQLADWGANASKIDALLEDAAGEQPGARAAVRIFRTCAATSGR
jgi:crotonobetainyl-CoA:carnitine CoA-transferase CaiB-like acyl-CoA transferase